MVEVAEFEATFLLMALLVLFVLCALFSCFLSSFGSSTLLQSHRVVSALLLPSQRHGNLCSQLTEFSLWSTWLLVSCWKIGWKGLGPACATSWFTVSPALSSQPPGQLVQLWTEVESSGGPLVSGTQGHPSQHPSLYFALRNSCKSSAAFFPSCGATLL
jgi:hypothetical protein